MTRKSEIDLKTLLPLLGCMMALVASAQDAKLLENGSVVIKAGPDWLPVDYVKDIEPGSALDFSGQGLQDAPAGKYGWLRNVGGHFEFEGRPGRPVRLYGVNLCFDANFPEPEEADRIVTRLVRLGYNAIRVHHADNDCVQGSTDRLTINEDRIRKLDYLLSRAYAAGLYVTTDLYTCRDVTWGDIGLPRPAWAKSDLVDKSVYKNLLAVHAPAFENWKAFARNFLNHVNAFTGRRYADEPALPLISLVNEGHLYMCRKEVFRLEPMKRAWTDWMAKRRAVNPDYGRNVSDGCEQAGDVWTAAFSDFMADHEIDLVARERAFLKELGVKAMLTSENCGWQSVALEAMRETCYDYVDDHFYVDHPESLGQAWSLPSRCGNLNPVQANWMPLENCAFTRLAGKPFTLTEWNFSGPGMFRGVGGLMTGAMGALQNWDGLWRFAYSHDLGNMRDRHGTASYFDLASDPLAQASDRACICLFLRRDLEPLSDNVALAYGRETFNVGNKWRDVVPKWQRETWNLRVATSVGGDTSGWTVFPVCSTGGVDVATRPPVVPPRNPAVMIDRRRGSFAVLSPRTAGGFTPSGAVLVGSLSFDVGSVAATVWVSTLDGLPIGTSRRMLVSHLTDVQADGNVYADEAKTVLKKWGRYPPVARNGTAAVELSLEDPSAYEVWGLATSGRRLDRIPTEVKNGKLRFVADVASKAGARLLYEVVKP